MSERPTEDQMSDELRRFGFALTNLLRMHAQAGNWPERRYVRKQISRQLREQRRAETHSRTLHLGFTQQMIDRYRAHSLAVLQRANDPSVDHARRYRDAQALERHAAEIRARVIQNPRLTRTEQGIALDGLDAATTFPEFEPGRLFANAHKVKGREALRYRAAVARTLRENPDLRAQPHLDERHERLIRTGDPAGRARKAPHPARGREWETTVRYHRSGSGGADTESVERGFHKSESAGADWARHTTAGLDIEPGTRVSVTSRHAQQPQPAYVAAGAAEEVVYELSERVLAAQERERSGPPAAQRATAAAPSADPPDRLGQVEARVRELAAEREQVGRELAVLRRGLDAVTADRDRLRTELDSATGQIEMLKNRQRSTAADRDIAAGQLAALTAERDRYKRERDEAVVKLSLRTLPNQRYGSAERVAAERTGADTQSWPAPASPEQQLREDAPMTAEQAHRNGQERNGHGRNGIERSR